MTDQDPRTGVGDGSGHGERRASWSGKKAPGCVERRHTYAAVAITRISPARMSSSIPSTFRQRTTVSSRYGPCTDLMTS